MTNKKDTSDGTVSVGNVYVMTHTLFSDVIRIGCTSNAPTEHAKALSVNTPGDYTVVFSLECNNPCSIEKKIKEYLNAQEYINEFYQVSPQIVEKMMKRETLRIPISTP